MSQKRQLPSAVCEGCHKGFSGMDAHNKRCRCGGLISAANHTNDWKECPDCQATGRVGDADCEPCHAQGWVYTGAGRPWG